MNDLLSLLGDLVKAAGAAGADAADAIFIGGQSVGVTRRVGKLEHLERSESQDIGLRVFVGRRSAIVSSSTVDLREFAALAERAVAMAKVLPEDPFGGLADEETGDPAADGLDLIDSAEPDEAALLSRAAQAEEAAMAVAGVTNSEGADAGWSRSESALVTSRGFAARVTRTSHSVSATALAGSGTGMQRDYDFSAASHLSDLEDAAGIGHAAGEKAVARLNPIRPATAKIPIVFDPRVASSLIGHLVGAANGASVARGTTFLKDKLGEKLFPSGVTIVDDPHRVRGLRSRRFDAEGVATRAWNIVDGGVLTTWLLDSRSARQLGLSTTGHAVRGTSSSPSPAGTNLYIRNGEMTPAALISDIALGFYVTELIGMGVNGLTGDYSRGAAGFMIRDGAIAEPAAEVTIAGNLLDMFAHVVPANDLRFRRGVDAPTIRVEGMTLAGA